MEPEEFEALADKLDELQNGIVSKERYLLPWSTGWAMVYHHNPDRQFIDADHYEIIYPGKFKLNLYYNKGLITLARDKRFEPMKFIDFPMEIKLEDYFKIPIWNEVKIPTALNKFSLEYKVERLFSLVVFT